MILVPVITVSSLITVAVLTYTFIDLPEVSGDVPSIAGNATIVVLVSDVHSHLPIRDDEEMLGKAVSILRRANVSLIIYAGDLEDLDVVRRLEEVAPVIAVHGNLDPP
ncbi:MAG: metallophosphoesterase family protein [Thermoproteota archaeon]